MNHKDKIPLFVSQEQGCAVARALAFHQLGPGWI